MVKDVLSILGKSIVSMGQLYSKTMEMQKATSFLQRYPDCSRQRRKLNMRQSQLFYRRNLEGQSGGSSIRYISTSPLPDRPQLLVNSTRLKSGLTLACGSAQ